MLDTRKARVFSCSSILNPLKYSSPSMFREDIRHHQRHHLVIGAAVADTLRWASVCWDAHKCVTRRRHRAGFYAFSTQSKDGTKQPLAIPKCAEECVPPTKTPYIASGFLVDGLYNANENNINIYVLVENACLFLLLLYWVRVNWLCPLLDITILRVL